MIDELSLKKIRQDAEAYERTCPEVSIVLFAFLGAALSGTEKRFCDHVVEFSKELMFALDLQKAMEKD